MRPEGQTPLVLFVYLYPLDMPPPISSLCYLVTAASTLFPVQLFAAKESPLVFAAFEEPNLGKWEITGEAFGAKPSAENQDIQKLANIEGKTAANSFHPKLGRSATGVLLSPPFIIQQGYIRFLIGGGYYPNTIGIHLLIDNLIVRSEMGNNSADLRLMQWDVKALVGKSAHIEIVDDEKGRLGHVVVDQIEFTNEDLLKPTDPKKSGLFAEFEGAFSWDSFIAAGWKVEGAAFGSGPTQDHWIPHQSTSGYLGSAYANSYANRYDNLTGRLISPEFKISQTFIRFLIGGGKQPENLGIRLVINDKVVRSSAGRDSGRLFPESWNVSDLMGQTARLEIFDYHQGAYSYVVVDQI